MAGAWVKAIESVPQADAEGRYVALRVRARSELTVARMLEGSGIETMCPISLDRRRLSDRVKVTPVALYPSYVFSKYEARTRLAMIKTPGVQEIVNNGRAPLPIDPSDVELLRRLASGGVNARPIPYLADGERVRVVCGPLAGTEGLLLRHKSASRIVLSIGMLQRSIVTEMPEDYVRPIS